MVTAAPLAQLVDAYRQAGAGPFSPAAGMSAWQRKVSPGNGGQERSCSDCHGSDLTRPGRHAKTGKLIKPLAPSVNPRRLTDRRKVEKWFRRNCRWTWGRECTAQEKGDFLSYIAEQ